MIDVSLPVFKIVQHEDKWVIQELSFNPHLYNGYRWSYTYVADGYNPTPNELNKYVIRFNSEQEALVWMRLNNPTLL